MDAKALAAAKLKAADQRRTHAATHALRSKGDAERARQRARSRMNSAASGLHRPPSSRARTTRRQRGARRSSGYVRSLARRAYRRAAPRNLRAWERGRPRLSRGDTRVVSTASWTPPHNGKPLAMTSRRRSSWRSTTTLKSRRRTLVATVAPASRQTLAAARSSGMPRERKSPTRGQAARWSPY